MQYNIVIMTKKIKVWPIISVILILVGFLQWLDNTPIQITNNAFLIIIAIIIFFRKPISKTWKRLDFSIQ